MRPIVLGIAIAVVACGSTDQPPTLGTGGAHVGGGGGGGGGGDAGSGSEAGMIGETIETLFLDTLAPAGASYSGPVTGTATLFAGTSYVLIVSGTFSRWSAVSWLTVCGGTPEMTPTFFSPGGDNGPVGLDAVWIFAWPTASTQFCPNGVSIGAAPRAIGNVIEVSVDNGTSFNSFRPRETALATGHVYHFDIIGGGHTAQVRGLPGLYGKLQIVIAKGS